MYIRAIKLQHELMTMKELPKLGTTICELTKYLLDFILGSCCQDVCMYMCIYEYIKAVSSLLDIRVLVYVRYFQVNSTQNVQFYHMQTYIPSHLEFNTYRGFIGPHLRLTYIT